MLWTLVPRTSMPAGCSEITTDPENYSAVVKAMEEKGYEILSDDLAMVPMTTTRLTDPDQLKLNREKFQHKKAMDEELI